MSDGSSMDNYANDGGGDGVPTAFHDLPESAFPVTMKAYGKNSGKELWSLVVEEPGAVYVPPLAKQHGEPVKVYVVFADGDCEEANPK